MNNLFIFGSSDSEGFAHFECSTDKNGAPLFDESRREISCDPPVEGFMRVWTGSSTRTGDCMYDLGELVVSSRLHSVLLCLAWRDIIHVPLTLQNRKSLPIGQGVAWWSAKEYGIANLQKSAVRYYTDCQVVRSIDRWVVQRSLVPEGLDIFKSNQLKWFVTERAAQAIEAIKPKGVVLTRVPVED